MEKSLKINCDGGARGNPGPAACAFVVAGDLQYKCGKYLGIATNNIAEYQAVIEALAWLITKIQDTRYKTQEISFFLDSNLVVNQINGLFKVKDAKLRELLLKVRELEAKISQSLTYSYVPREENREADRLVNETLDKV